MQKSVGNLTLVEKIGQMVLVGIDGTEPEGDIIELIQTYRIGGIILKHKNIENIEQLQRLINSLKSANLGNSVPLFIAMSQETGRGNELPKEIRKFPSAKYITDNADKRVLYDVHSITANILKKIGVNMNFSPLLDMGGMVDGIPLGDRVFSNTNTTIVSINGLQTINAYKDNGIICVPKYFPSHTYTKSDRSNIIIPFTKRSLSKMEQFELVPFKYVIDEGIDTMLVGNIHVSKLNMFSPATMSNRVVTKLLKGRYNFEGISIADDVCSTCIKVQYNVKDAAKKSIIAGNDIVIISDVRKAKGILEDFEKHVMRGSFDEKVVEARVQKILDLKAKYDLNDNELEPLDVENLNKKIEELLNVINQK